MWIKIASDQSTSIFNPEKWNDDSLVIDPWQRTVYTKQEFLLVNSLANFYGLNDHIQGETEITELPTLYCSKSISLNSSLAVKYIAALFLETPCVFSISAI
jgi:hypothetical protein